MKTITFTRNELFTLEISLITRKARIIKMISNGLLSKELKTSYDTELKEVLDLLTKVRA